MLKDNIIFDGKTKTTWISKDFKLGTWKKSKTYCDEIKVKGYYFCELPSVYLLTSLINYEDGKHIIRTPILNITADKYWTSTLYANNNKRAWVLDFKTGKHKAFSINTKFKTICICKE